MIILLVDWHFRDTWCYCNEIFHIFVAVLKGLMYIRWVKKERDFTISRSTYKYKRRYCSCPLYISLVLSLWPCALFLFFEKEVEKRPTTKGFFFNQFTFMANPEDPKEEAKAEAKRSQTALVIMMYMLCSSTMLIFNKVSFSYIIIFSFLTNTIKGSC